MLSGLAANRTERGKNVVITLNYDLLVEEAARRLNVPVTYELGSTGVAIEPDAEVETSATFQILKLHGSMNWAEKADGSILVCRDYERVRSHELAPLLLPPTWNKNLADALLGVWDAAVRAIEVATRVILIGFSIPAADQHFKYLLAAGLKENSSLRLVRIVDPRAGELRGQYDAVFRGEQFKYGVVSACEKRAADFFYDEFEIGLIGRMHGHPGLNIVDDGRTGGHRIILPV